MAIVTVCSGEGCIELAGAAIELMTLKKRNEWLGQGEGH